MQTKGCSEFGWLYSVAYTHASGLCAIVIRGESSFWMWFSYTFLLPLYITDTSSLSSQEASESSQGLQQASTVPGHNEKGILPLYVAVYVKPNKGKSLNVHCKAHCLSYLLVCGAYIST